MGPNQEKWELPDFFPDEFRPKRNPYCVCVFAVNEGERLRKQLKRMADLDKKIDIVIADGGSTDGSTQKSRLKNFGVNTLLTLRGRPGLGAQMRMAFAWAIKRGYEGVIIIDGNNKDSVTDIPNFIEALGKGCDHVQGSRFIEGGHHENTPLSRILGLKLIHAPLIRLASHFQYTDTTNGFRGYSKKLLTDPRISVFRNIFTGYELHYYLAICAPKLGYKCIEIPVTRTYPSEGNLPTKISGMKGNLQVILRLIETVTGKYNIKDN